METNVTGNIKVHLEKLFLFIAVNLCTLHQHPQVVDAHAMVHSTSDNNRSLGTGQTGPVLTRSNTNSTHTCYLFSVVSWLAWFRED